MSSSQSNGSGRSVDSQVPTKLGFFVIAFVGSLVCAGGASAAYGQHRYQLPAIACQNSGMSPYYSNMSNWTSSPQTLRCPVISEWDQGYGGYFVCFTDLNVEVSPHGWANTSSCHTAMSTGASSWWIKDATVVQNNGSVDNIRWDANSACYQYTTNGHGADVECSFPPNATMLGYNSRTEIYFDYTTW
jgi:hypothetical protein